MQQRERDVFVTNAFGMGYGGMAPFQVAFPRPMIPRPEGLSYWSLTASRSGRRIWSMSLSGQALVTTFATASSPKIPRNKVLVRFRATRSRRTSDSQWKNRRQRAVQRSEILRGNPSVCLSTSFHKLHPR